MADEIERKFLVDPAKLPPAEGVLYVQGYLSRSANATVRVRIAGAQGYITIKGNREGAKRPEFEYEIPLQEARELLQLCEEKPVEKIRRVIRHAGHDWEVDEFLGDNKGLWLAEVELQHENEVFAKPEWTGREVTGDSRYYNANLARRPYSTWGSKGASPDLNCG